jgi:lactate permease
LIIASVQSIGGSLGSAIAPAKVLIGSSLVGLAGREHEVMRQAIPYCLGIVFLVGIEALIAVLIC